jgi:LAO/AO transport system kinase
VNKADGEHAKEAGKAARELAGALRMLRSGDDLWSPPVLTCSGMTGDGLAKVWEQIEQHHRTLDEAGELAAKRRTQQVDWTWSMVRDTLMTRLRDHPEVRSIAPELERDVRDGRVTPTLAAERILKAFGLR